MKNKLKKRSKQIITTFLVVIIFGLCNPMIAQSQNVLKGKVLDPLEDPLVGVSIVSKNSDVGTITDINGEFSISVKPGEVIRISYIGFIQQEIEVKNFNPLLITLYEDTKNLEEIVVVGYGTQKKINLTGSISSVSAEELANKPVMSTAQAIAGLAPGLSVLQTSGRPGTGAMVKIRGTGTFSSAGNDPLVLIDGLSGSIDDVDPTDIQSISFLKDAASASIYGNRAANGVILIETKKGSSGKTLISYNTSFGWQNPTQLPDFLPSWEYATYYNMAMQNMDKQDAYTPEQIQKFRDGSDPDNYPNVNHLKWLLEQGSGFQHQHNISIQGGNATTGYNISVGFRNQDGMTPETSNRRMTALVALKTELGNGLSLNLNLNAYNNRYVAPNGEPQSIDQIIGYAVRQGPIYAGQKSDGSFGYQDNYSPQAWLAGESFVKNINRNISTSAQLQWTTPIKGLSFSGRAGVNYWTKYDKAYRAETYFDKSKTVGPSALNIWSANNTYTTLEALSTYEFQLGGHSFKLLGGTSLEQSTNQGLEGYRNTFPNNNLHELGSGDKATATNNSDLSEYALVSLFGRINYSLKERYLLEANLRYDGSSRFAENNRWGFFPSVSGGWRITEEDFWKNNTSLSSAVDNLKLRLSYGVLGNQNIGTYPYQQTYSLGHDYPFGNPATLAPGAYISVYNNEDITWEKTSITDIGLDFSLFRGRFSGTIDYFYKYTSDILAPVEAASIMGRSVGQSNVGAVSNRGIELNLTYNGKIGNNFRFSIAPNFTWVKNEVEKLANGVKEEINNNRIVGQPIGIIYGYKTEGLFVDQDEIDKAPNQLVDKGSLKPGYVKYKDISGENGTSDGKVDAQYDRTVLGSTTPKYYYGLNLTASYKGFDFSALLQGLGGHKRLIGSYMAYAFYNGGQIQRWQADNCWTEENPNKWAEYPRIETLNMNNTNLQVSDYWIRDASFLRLKNLQLGYTLPSSISKKAGISNIRVYISGQNLLSFNSFYKGWDPENEIGTGDAPSYYPINRIYSFGLNVKF
ncbi:TonB-dependent receptor [Dysgonomonas sp. Marseille-P4677]|uniref:SusC/RagA family TonB-linked outer membrane protein n=1 Tax=Dysgonomonas sp. Marseille-P4677 TaxID=2364790 RepID=UPI0019126B55|nr:TonB-dependent receptor [Dysgonomonas sp. Marseille-P4677]MBK5722276.1 TonB-dependent receptor [Dysgonomonas sp. Marseille-P4677]